MLLTSGLPATYLVKYFNDEGREWQINPEVQTAITYRELNLAKPCARLRCMDLVLMRNVLIYFDPETRKDILQRTRKILNPGGKLLLGSAETVMTLSEEFETQRYGKVVCFKAR